MYPYDLMYARLSVEVAAFTNSMLKIGSIFFTAYTILLLILVALVILMFVYEK